MGRWVLKKVKAEIGDLYPLIPDPAFKGKRKPAQQNFAEEDEGVPLGYLTPVAYLWTRTVTCKNPACRATVPLLRQTWLCKKKDHFVALKVIVPKGAKRVRFEVAESGTELGLGFDPAQFSKAGNSTCPFCETVANNDYAKVEGCAGRIGMQPMAVVCTRPGARGKVYLAADGLPPELLPAADVCRRRIVELCERTGLTVPDEPIINDAKNANFCILYGLDQFSKLFTPRQMLSLLTFAAAVRQASQALSVGSAEHAKAVASMLACALDKVIDCNTALCTWEPIAPVRPTSVREASNTDGLGLW